MSLGIMGIQLWLPWNVANSKCGSASFQFLKNLMSLGIMRIQLWFPWKCINVGGTWKFINGKTEIWLYIRYFRLNRNRTDWDVCIRRTGWSDGNRRRDVEEVGKGDGGLDGFLSDKIWNLRKKCKSFTPKRTEIMKVVGIRVNWHI